MDAKEYFKDLFGLKEVSETKDKLYTYNDMINFGEQFSLQYTQSLQDKVKELEKERDILNTSIKHLQNIAKTPLNVLRDQDEAISMYTIDSLQSALTESKLREERLSEDVSKWFNKWESFYRLEAGDDDRAKFFRTERLNLLSSNQADKK